MPAGVSEEYSSASFPTILAPQVAQVRDLMQQLNDYARADSGHQRSLQAMSLTRLFRWAHTHSPYWAALLETLGAPDFPQPWQTLAALPVLRRQDLQESEDQISCVAALPEDSCVAAHSTGSTGQPVRTWKERQPYWLRYLAFTGLTTQWHQLDRSQSMLRISARVQDGEQAGWGPPDTWFEATGPLYLAQFLGRDVQDLYERVIQHRPGYVVVVASLAQALARRALAENAEPPRIEAILSTGETVTEALRRDCREAFGAKVIDRYTCEEAGWLALQCPQYDHLHVITANALLEIVDREGRPCPVGVPGRVLLTALHSEAMPLIRYDLGDIAEWGSPCDCGINLPVIKQVWGRENQGVYTPDGHYRYVVLVAEDFLDIVPLTDIRLRYYQDAVAVLELACETDLTDEQHRALTAKVKELVGQQCEVRIIARRSLDWGHTEKRLGFAAVDAPAPASS